MGVILVRPTGLYRYLTFLLFLAVTACSQTWNRQHRIDGAWFRDNLQQAHLVHWLAAADTTSGFYNSARDRHWQALPAQPGDLVAQARLIYVLAAGYDQTQDAAYLRRLKLGADFLLSAYQDKTYGGFYDAVSPQGLPTNDAKRLYSQAFAILALSHAYRVSRDQRYATAALAAWRVVDERFRDADGGYRTAMDRGYTGGGGNGQNGIMHLFEALIALHEATKSDEAQRGAKQVGNFVVYKLMQGEGDGSAHIPEFFAPGWLMLTPEQGGYTDIGHQFEWAWLLSAAAAQGINPVYAGVADRLLAFAVRRGIDPSDGSIYSTVTSKGLLDGSKGYWQQAEALRAMMRFAVWHERDDLWGRISQLTEYIRSEFVDADNGGWYAHPASQCRKTPACLTQQPDGYHMVALHREAIRLTESN
ncbi:AGE family epimerase/isomerase [Chitinimonas naiadis]